MLCRLGSGHRVSDRKQQLIGFRPALGWQERALADRRLDLASIHKGPDQGQTRPDCEAFGGTILQETPPLVRSSGGAFEAGGPDRHARVLQGSSGPCIGEEGGGMGWIRVGDRECLVEKTLPLRIGE